MPALKDTIVAPATPPGVGALGVIRVSGTLALAIVDKVFRGDQLSKASSHTVHYGHIHDPDSEKVIDEVMATVLRAPKSFTTEDTVEISCHGSPVIVRDIMSLLVRQGARPAEPGEFTLRAFLRGRIDLAQAEAVADLIESESSAARETALNQLRGGVSKRIAELRQQLIDFAALVELELDFSEEDVEFADRERLVGLVNDLRSEIQRLIYSFKLGDALKQGVATVIAGRPNAGKSTLLNALLQEERAIVSSIPGTTRDTIEEVLHIDGVGFRLIDTAGIREATDAIEQVGVERTHAKIRESALMVYVFDLTSTSPEDLQEELAALDDSVPRILLGNKIDEAPEKARRAFALMRPIWISAKTGEGVEELRKILLDTALGDEVKTDDTVVSNLRHYEALLRADQALADVLAGIQDTRSGEMVALDIRQSLDALGSITGEVTGEDVLDSIFSRFCIGK